MTPRFSVRLACADDPRSVKVTWTVDGRLLEEERRSVEQLQRNPRLPRRSSFGVPGAGQELARWLCSVGVTEAIRAAIDAASATNRVGILLAIADDAPESTWLKSLPWELLDIGNEFVAQPLLAGRYVDLIRVHDPPFAGASLMPERTDRLLRILPVTGARSAHGYSRLPDAHLQQVLAGQVSNFGGIEVLDEVSAPTVAELAERLEALRAAGMPADMLVYLGHGEPGGLVLTDGAYERAIVSGGALAEALRGRVLVAVLDACHSADDGVDVSGVAEALADAGVHAVAWHGQVAVGVATTFVASLAEHLRRGWPLPSSVSMAREELIALQPTSDPHARIALWQPGEQAAALPRQFDLAESERGWTSYVPRLQLHAAVQRALDDKTTRVVVLQSAPGGGKSTYLRETLASDPRTVAELLTDPALRRPDRLDHRTLCRRIGEQLARFAGNHVEWCDRWPTKASQQEEREALLDAAGRAAARGGVDGIRHLIVIDGLNEYAGLAVQSQVGDVRSAAARDELLTSLVRALGPDFVLVCGTQNVLPALGMDGVQYLDLASFPDDAIEAYLHRVVRTPCDIDRADVVSRIARYADRVFYVARVVVELAADKTLAEVNDLIDGLMLLSDADNRLAALYRVKFAGINETLRRTLQIMAACLDPAGFTFHQLADIAPEHPGEPNWLNTEATRRMLLDGVARPFLTVAGDRVRPSHDSLTQWLRRANEVETHRAIANTVLEKRGELRFANYASHALAGHMVLAARLTTDEQERAEICANLMNLLLDAGWLTALVAEIGPAEVGRQLALAAAAGVSDLDHVAEAVTRAGAYRTTDPEHADVASLAGLAQVASYRRIKGLVAAARTALADLVDDVLVVAAVTPKPPAAERTIHLVDGYALSVAAPPTGDGLAVGMRDGTIGLWRERSRVGFEPDFVLQPAIGSIEKLVWSPDGAYLAAGGDHAVAVWSTSAAWARLEPRMLGSVGGAPGAALSLVWTEDSAAVAAEFADSTVAVWSSEGTRSGGSPAVVLLPGERGVPRASLADGLAWHSNGTRLSARSSVGRVETWRVRDGADRWTAEPVHASEPFAEMVRSRSTHWLEARTGLRPVTAQVEMADGRLYAAAGGHVVELRTASETIPCASSDTDRGNRAGYVEARTADGRRLGFTRPGGGRQVFIRGSDSSAVPVVATPFAGVVRALAWSADAHHLAVLGSRSTVIVRIDDGDAAYDRLQLPDVRAVAWHPRSLRLALGDETGTVHIFDATLPEAARLVQAMALGLGAVTTLTWSDQGITVFAVDGYQVDLRPVETDLHAG